MTDMSEISERSYYIGEKWYICQFCQKSFADNYTGENYEYRLSNRLLRTQGHQKRNIKIHAGDASFRKKEM